jgi:uncharacterized membrane protein YtjA (UPF0391 family)
LTGLSRPQLPGLISRITAILFPPNRQISRFDGAEPTLPACIDFAVGARRRSRRHRERNINRGRIMLSWVVTFLVVALIAGVLGFGGIAGASVEIAKTIFFIAVVLFLISAVVGLVRGRSNV